MEDKTPLYMVMIVAIVALVGIIIMVSSGPRAAQSVQATSNTLTGNVVADTSGVSLNDFGKVFFTIFLVGIAAYMYFRNE